MTAYLLAYLAAAVPLALLNRNRCHALVQLPGNYCLNVAVAGSIVMYDRTARAAAPALSVAS